MRKVLVLIPLTLISVLLTFSQSYLGYTIESASLRSGPGANYTVVGELQAGADLFVISKDKINDYYEVLDITTNTEGFVYACLVEITEELPENKEGIFSPEGNIDTFESEVEIYNDTDLTLTLKMNDDYYEFAPQEKSTLRLTPGPYKYRASAPGVLPDHGTEKIEKNTLYIWRFYIVTLDH